VGFALASAHLALDTLGALLTKKYGCGGPLGLDALTVNFVRFGFAALALGATATVAAAAAALRGARAPIKATPAAAPWFAPTPEGASAWPLLRVFGMQPRS